MASERDHFVGWTVFGAPRSLSLAQQVELYVQTYPRRVVPLIAELLLDHDAAKAQALHPEGTMTQQLSLADLTVDAPPPLTGPSNHHA